jgi:hypothetical protein
VIAAVLVKRGSGWCLNVFYKFSLTVFNKAWLVGCAVEGNDLMGIMFSNTNKMQIEGQPVETCIFSSQLDVINI